MSKRRFATGGAGYQTPFKTRHSKIRYGLLIDPAKADNKSVVINLKMIQDQVCSSRQCELTTEAFLNAMADFANNPNIVWDRETAKDEFLKMADDLWHRRCVA